MKYFRKHVVFSITNLVLLILVAGLFSCFDTTGKKKKTDTGMSAPTGVTASDGAYTDRIVVSWNAVTNAVTYNVHRSTDNSTWTPIGSISSTYTSTYNSTSSPSSFPITVGTTYYYCVTALDADNNESERSNSDSGYAYSTVSSHCTLKFINSSYSYYPVTDLRLVYNLSNDPSCDYLTPSTYGDNLLTSNLLHGYYISILLGNNSYADWYFKNSMGLYGYDDKMTTIASKKWGVEEVNTVVWDDTAGTSGTFTYYQIDYTPVKDMDVDLKESGFIKYDPENQVFEKIASLNELEN